jgi:hypothetical protein
MLRARGFPRTKPIAMECGLMRRRGEGRMDRRGLTADDADGRRSGGWNSRSFHEFLQFICVDLRHLRLIPLRFHHLILPIFHPRFDVFSSHDPVRGDPRTKPMTNYQTNPLANSGGWVEKAGEIAPNRFRQTNPLARYDVLSSEKCRCSGRGGFPRTKPIAMECGLKRRFNRG